MPDDDRPDERPGPSDRPADGPDLPDERPADGPDLPGEATDGPDLPGEATADRSADADPVLLAEADRLDTVIDATLAGRPGRASDPTVLWLAASLRTEPPTALRARVERAAHHHEARRWRAPQVAAAALAVLLAGHGLGNLLDSEWVAEGVGEAHSPHAYTEGGLALLAVAVVVGAGLFRHRLLGLSVAAGTPLGLGLGVIGLGELSHFAAGAALHLTQATVAIALAALWWRARRDRSPPTDEGGT